jgi:hypothetical protein
MRCFIARCRSCQQPSYRCLTGEAFLPTPPKTPCVIGQAWAPVSPIGLSCDSVTHGVSNRGNTATSEGRQGPITTSPKTAATAAAAAKGERIPAVTWRARRRGTRRVARGERAPNREKFLGNSHVAMARRPTRRRAYARGVGQCLTGKALLRRAPECLTGHRWRVPRRTQGPVVARPPRRQSS